MTAAPVDTYELTVDHRYRGPDGIANGGWLAGRLCELLGAGYGETIEIVLKAPTRTGQPVRLVRNGTLGRLADPDGRELVLIGPGSAARRPPPFVDEAAAHRAGRSSPGNAWHPFPGCFVCGTDRPEGDGLRLFVGPHRREPDLYAGVWRPHAEPGRQTAPFTHMWAAMDCPTGWVHYQVGTRALLGSITATVHSAARAGEPHVVVAQNLRSEGRRRYSAGAVYTAAGAILAECRTTWVTL